MSTEHGQQQKSGGRRSRGSGDKKSRRRSRRKETYSMYIYKVLKQVRGGAQRVRSALAPGGCRTGWDRGLGLVPAPRRGASRRLHSHSVSEVPTSLGNCRTPVMCRGHLKPVPHHSLEAVRALGQTS